MSIRDTILNLEQTQEELAKFIEDAKRFKPDAVEDLEAEFEENELELSVLYKRINKQRGCFRSFP